MVRPRKRLQGNLLEHCSSRFRGVFLTVPDLLVSLLVLLPLSSCGGSKHSGLSHEQADLIYTEQLIRQYGHISGSPFDQYLTHLTKKLVDGSSQPMKEPIRPVRCQTLLLNTSTVFALSLANGSIMISKGLFLRLSNEAELAFVIAHELAHTYLNHFQKGDFKNSRKIREIEYELAADKQALKTVVSAGYEPRAAVGALSKAYSSSPSWADSKQDQEEFLKMRSQAVIRAIKRSNRRTLALTDHRDFRKISALLRLVPDT